MVIKRFDKYKQNLCMIDDSVYSYSTHVAEANYKDMTLKKLGYWSQTTSKHINYAAKELGLEVV